MTIEEKIDLLFSKMELNSVSIDMIKKIFDNVIRQISELVKEIDILKFNQQRIMQKMDMSIPQYAKACYAEECIE